MMKIENISDGMEYVTQLLKELEIEPNRVGESKLEYLERKLTVLMIINATQNQAINKLLRMVDRLCSKLEPPS